MAYFAKHTEDTPHEPVFQTPLREDDPFEDDDLPDEIPENIPSAPLSDEAFAAREERERRKDTMRLLGGVGNLLGVLGGMLVILLLVWLLISVGNWMIRDLSHSFQLVNNWFGVHHG